MHYSHVEEVLVVLLLKFQKWLRRKLNRFSIQKSNRCYGYRNEVALESSRIDSTHHRVPIDIGCCTHVKMVLIRLCTIFSVWSLALFDVARERHRSDCLERNGMSRTEASPEADWLALVFYRTFSIRQLESSSLLICCWWTKVDGTFFFLSPNWREKRRRRAVEGIVGGLLGRDWSVSNFSCRRLKGLNHEATRHRRIRLPAATAYGSSNERGKPWRGLCFLASSMVSRDGVVKGQDEEDNLSDQSDVPHYHARTAHKLWAAANAKRRDRLWRETGRAENAPNLSLPPLFWRFSTLTRFFLRIFLFPFS